MSVARSIKRRAFDEVVVNIVKPLLFLNSVVDRYCKAGVG